MVQRSAARSWSHLAFRLLAASGLLASSQVAACAMLSGEIGNSPVQYQGGPGPSPGGNFNPALGGPTRGGTSGGT